MLIDMDKTIKTLYFSKAMKAGIWHKGWKLRYNILLYILEGSVKMKVDTEILQLSAGDILLIPKDTFYAPMGGGEILFYRICFETSPVADREVGTQIEFAKNDVEDGYKYSFFKVNPIIHVKVLTHCASNRAVKDIIKKMTELNIWQNSSLKLRFDIYLRELLSLISVEAMVTETINPKLRRILKYIDNNYAEDITLTSLSEQFNLSMSYIARLFRDELNTNTVDYINKSRASAACNLLLNTDLSIAEISEKVGFRYPNYFTHVFQEIYKTTPSKFRRGCLTE